MPLKGFEPAIPASERLQTKASDSAATGTDVNSTFSLHLIKIRGLPWELCDEFNTSDYSHSLCVHKRTQCVPTQMYTTCTDVSCMVYVINSDYFTQDVKRLVCVAEREYFLYGGRENCIQYPQVLHHTYLRK
jgi:hypothetical protein